jgi:hypothetical protein
MNDNRKAFLFSAAPFLVLLLLGAFTGGTTTQQWLSASGTAAAPAYSFSTDTNLGIYRREAGSICAVPAGDANSATCFKSGQMLINSVTSTAGVLEFVDGVSTPLTIMANNTFVGAQYNSTVDIFLGARSGTPILAPHLAGTTTNAMSFTPSSGNLVMGNSSGTAWSSGSNNIGGSNTIAMNHKFSIGAGDLYSLETDDNTGISSATTDEVSWVAGGTTVAYSRGNNLLEIADGKYLRVGAVTGTTAVANCSSAAEDGRVVVNYSDNRVYVCNYTGSTSWMYFDLTE